MLNISGLAIYMIFQCRGTGGLASSGEGTRFSLSVLFFMSMIFLWGNLRGPGICGGICP